MVEPRFPYHVLVIAASLVAITAIVNLIVATVALFGV